MQEIISLRTEESKTFNIGANQRRVEIAIGAIHYKDDYKDSKEQWKEIDLTIVDGKVTKAPYTLVIDANKVTVTDKKTGKVSVVELSHIGSERLSKSSFDVTDKASKKNISPDVDYDLVLTESSVKFQRTIKSAEAIKDATFKISGDLDVSYHAYDAEGDPVEVEITTSKSGEITESFKSEKDFVKDGKAEKKAVVYPVKIDPTLTIQPSSKDTSLDASNPGTCYDAILFTGDDKVNFTYHMLAEFSISSIPSGATINSATLSLYYTGYYSAYGWANPKDRNIRLALLRRTNWVSNQATWNVYKTGSNWGTAGALNTSSDINTSYTADSSIPDSANNWMNWNVKSMVEHQISNSVSVLGVNGYQTGAGQYSTGYFASRTYSTTSLRPKLVIECDLNTKITLTDTQSLSDSLSRVFSAKRTLADTQSLSDSIKKKTKKALSETQSFADAVTTKNSYKALEDITTIADEITGSEIALGICNVETVDALSTALKITFRGLITGDGAAVRRGFCYGEFASPEPDLDGDFVEEEGFFMSGNFSMDTTGTLKDNCLYFYRAFIEDRVLGILYGELESVYTYPKMIENILLTSIEKDIIINFDNLPERNYNIYWNTTTSVSKRSAKIENVYEPPFAHTDLIAGRMYYYSITAVGNESGLESELSEVLGAMAGEMFYIPPEFKPANWKEYDDYILLLTSQYQLADKFKSWLGKFITMGDDIRIVANTMNDAMDIDFAEGIQLDIIGQIVGMKRLLPFELSSSAILDDRMYRKVLKCQIALNHWNGQFEPIQRIWKELFEGTNITVVDNQNMTMNVNVSGDVADVLKGLIENNYIIPKPMGVGVIYAWAEKIKKTFYYDLRTTTLGGYGEGHWDKITDPQSIKIMFGDESVITDEETTVLT